MELTGAQTLVESLEAMNVRHIFGISGHGNYHILDAIYDSEIDFILVRHEQAAAHMADGYARVLNQPGVCCSSVGPGAANMIMPIISAFSASSPVVAITGGVISKWYGKGQLQELTRPETPSWQCYPAAMRFFTKYSWQVHRANRIPEVIQKAFQIAIGGRPGPVHVEIPWDIQAEHVLTEKPTPQRLGFALARAGGDPDLLKKAAGLLMNSDRPVILAGNGVVLSGAESNLLELATVLGAPVATSLLAKGAIPEDHSLSLGTVGWYGCPAAHEVIRNHCDVLLAVGCRFSDETTCWWTEGYPFVRETKLIQVDVEYTEIGKNYSVEVGILGDAKVIIKELTTICRKKSPSAASSRHWIDHVVEIKNDLQPIYATPQGTKGVNPFLFAEELRKALPRDSIIFVDTGQHATYVSFSPLFPAFGSRTIINPGGWTPMGFAPMAAIGGKLARPERTVVSFSGDGGFYMGCQEVITAVEHDLPVIWIVFNNQSLGAIRTGQKEMFGKRYIGTAFKMSANFVRFAEAFRANGLRIEKDSEVKSALLTAIRSDEPYVLDVQVDPDAPIPPIAGEWYDPTKHEIKPRPRIKTT